MTNGKKPYTRPTITAMTSAELLERIGPAQASVYAFSPLPEHGATGTAGGGGTLQGR